MDKLKQNKATIIAWSILLTISAVAPLLTIASLNSLFSIGASYSFGNWLAVSWLTTVMVAVGITANVFRK